MRTGLSVAHSQTVVDIDIRGIQDQAIFILPDGSLEVSFLVEIISGYVQTHSVKTDHAAGAEECCVIQCFFCVIDKLVFCEKSHGIGGESDGYGIPG